MPALWVDKGRLYSHLSDPARTGECAVFRVVVANQPEFCVREAPQLDATELRDKRFVDLSTNHERLSTMQPTLIRHLFAVLVH